MKIAILFDNLGPYHLCRLEAASRICTVLAVQVNERSSDYPWETPPGRPGFAIETLNHANRFVSSRSEGQNERLRRVLEEFTPDCVFIPGWSRSYSLAALNWCRLHEVPAVLMSESTEQDRPRSVYKEWVKSQIIGMFSTALVGGTPQSAYLVRLGMPPERIFRGYNVVDNEHFRRGGELARARANQLKPEFLLPDRYFLASARFVKRKNLHRLLEAYANYLEALEGSDFWRRPRQASCWSLVLLGDGPERNALEGLVSELSLEAFVHLPGFRQYQELPVYYAFASAFIHPSISEPWGLVVNEAMASGLPVLVSNRCGSAQDLVRDGRNGFTFDPFDVAQITSRMLQLSHCQNLEVMSKMSLEQIRLWSPKSFADGVRESAETAASCHWGRLTSFPDTVLQLVFGR